MNSQQHILDIRTGTDIVYIPRLEAAYQRFGDAFFKRVLTPSELAYCKNNFNKISGRIAVKEAVAKALGTGIRGLGWAAGAPWQDIEVQSENNAVPTLTLHGRALEYAQEQGIADWRISLSHDGEYATATVLGLIR